VVNILEKQKGNLKIKATTNSDVAATYIKGRYAWQGTGLVEVYLVDA
jgi:hypothetical protein